MVASYNRDAPANHLSHLLPHLFKDMGFKMKQGNRNSGGYRKLQEVPKVTGSGERETWHIMADEGEWGK